MLLSKGDFAYFKHPQAVVAGEVLRMQVEAGKNVFVGYAGKEYEPAKDDETYTSTAWVDLSDGTTCINSDLSLDEEPHAHPRRLRLLLPQTEPFTVALRCNQEGHMPQVQFNEDGVWHDFVPSGRAALKAGPWFPYLALHEGDRVGELRVDRPKATKSAGKNRTGTVAGGIDESDSPPQKKIRRSQD
jgi:hypothetical protein